MKAQNLTISVPPDSNGEICDKNCKYCISRMTGYIEHDYHKVLANIDKVKTVAKAANVSSVLITGKGEPMLNFDNVVSAMNLMMEDHAYGLSRKRVTLSTSGLVPAIDKLAETSDVSLAISLHATNDELRNKLVPINKSFPIAKLMEACKRYAKIRAVDTITFEYVMLDGINDSEAEARMLVKLMNGIPAKINLIPFNPFPGTDYTCSSTVTINKFRDILIKGGLFTITRKTRGEDIDAACGQLVGKVMARAKKHQHH